MELDQEDVSRSLNIEENQTTSKLNNNNHTDKPGEEQGRPTTTKTTPLGRKRKQPAPKRFAAAGLSGVAVVGQSTTSLSSASSSSSSSLLSSLLLEDEETAVEFPSSSSSASSQRKRRRRGISSCHNSSLKPINLKKRENNTSFFVIGYLELEALAERELEKGERKEEEKEEDTGRRRLLLKKTFESGKEKENGEGEEGGKMVVYRSLRTGELLLYFALQNNNNNTSPFCVGRLKSIPSASSSSASSLEGRTVSAMSYLLDKNLLNLSWETGERAEGLTLGSLEVSLRRTTTTTEGDREVREAGEGGKWKGKKEGLNRFWFRSLRILLEHFYPLEIKEAEEQEEEEEGEGQSNDNNNKLLSCGREVDEFYNAIRPTGEEPKLDPLPSSLLTQLRPYQRRAVAWMVSRERSHKDNNDTLPQLEGRPQPLHPFWVKLTSRKRQHWTSENKQKEEEEEVEGEEGHLYYNKLAGRLTSNRREALRSGIEEEGRTEEEVHGGILADEMGLGKSLEVITCILENPNPRSTSPSSSSSETVGNKTQQDGEEEKEVVKCVCGMEESEDFEGLWVQCVKCETWQHANCVGFEGAESADFSLAEGQAVQEERNYLCHNCLLGHLSSASSPSSSCCMTGTTLIVCPDTLVTQWIEEITKHTICNSLSVWVYEGIRQLQRSSSSSTSSTIDKRLAEEKQRRQERSMAFRVARTLAQKDIVITSYTTLRSDFNHLPTSSSTSSSFSSGDSIPSSSLLGGRYDLRNEKKYEAVVTPLVLVKWWRVCLDESQMVETKTSKAAEMAGFIEANHRWCITGTPVQSNFPGDLYGLLSFLRASPYQERSWFNKVIERPFQQQRLQQVQNNKNLHQHKVEQEKEFVYQLFRRLMWRNTKEDVREEVRLPRQHQHTTLLPFSTVEAHFYRKQHEECTAVLQRKLADYFSSSPSSSHWSAHSLGKILHPVLKLRQVCCHPQVGGGASAKFYSLQKNTMTMEELLNSLIQKAKMECIEAQRELVMTMNGLAAICIIRNQLSLAQDIYKRIIHLDSPAPNGDPSIATVPTPTSLSAEEGVFDTHLPLDPSQKLHAISNLREVLFRLHSQQQQEPMEVEVKGKGKEVEMEGEVEKKEQDQESLEFRRVREEGIHPSYLAKMEEEIERSFTRDSLLRSEQTKANWNESKVAIREAEKKAASEKADLKGWWSSAFTLLKAHNSGTLKDLLGRLKTLFIDFGERNNIAFTFQSEREAALTLYRRMELLNASKERVYQKLELLDKPPTPDEAAKVAACEKCGSSLSTPHPPTLKCPFCSAEKALSSYETHLFSTRRKRQQQQSSSRRRGLRGAATSSTDKWKGEEGDENEIQTDALGESLLDRCLRQVAAALKNNLGTSRGGGGEGRRGEREAEEKEEAEAERNREEKKRAIEGSVAYFEMMELWKKEWKQMSLWWRARKYHFLKVDELSVSRTRTELQQNIEEVIPSYMKPWRLYPVEVDAFDLRYRSQRLTAEKTLKEAKGQWLYLQKLRIQRQKDTAPSLLQQQGREEDTDCCPVCYDTLGDQIVVLSCGHGLCAGCGEDMINRSVRGWVRCPFCRATSNTSEMSYVMNKTTTSSSSSLNKTVESEEYSGEEAEEKNITVVGNYGSKIDGVIRRLKFIQQRDSGAKTLVFSHWQDVLELLSRALNENHIPFLRLTGDKKHKMQQLALFKNSKNNQQKREKKEPGESGKEEEEEEDPASRILLLPLGSGGNGLTLVEARHVVLVEAIPDTALEAQVVSRVHRLGQTKETHVHRFLIQNSIEEAIFRHLHPQSHPSSSSTLALNSTTNSSTGGIRKSKKQFEELSPEDLKVLFGLSF